MPYIWCCRRLVLLIYQSFWLYSERSFAIVVGMSSRPDPATAVDLAAVAALAEQWCGSVDPARLTGSDAAQGAERLAVVIRRYQAVQVLLARRAEECNSYAA